MDIISDQHILMEQIKKDKEKYANLFSEGDESLRDLLLYCWNNGIDTYKSNVGKPDEDGSYESNPPYIVFDIPFHNKEQLNRIIDIAYNLSDVSNQNDIDKLMDSLNLNINELEYIKRAVNVNNIHLWIWMAKTFNKNSLLIDIVSFSGKIVFKQLLDSFKKIYISKQNDVFENIISFLNHFHKESYQLNCKMVKNGDNVLYEMWESEIHYLKEDKQHIIPESKQVYQSETELLEFFSKDITSKSK